MSQAILGIDHAVIAVDDLEAARGVYERLGFTHVPMGNHQNRATANHCIMFPDTYLELLGINQPELPDFGFKEFLATRGQGLQRLANGTGEADDIARDLKARGLKTQGPILLERPQEAPAGMVTFHNVMIDKAQTAGIWTFFCCHRTPDLMRTPAWLTHANGANALASATSIVEDLGTARAALAKVYGIEQLHDTAYGFKVEPPKGKVQVTTPAQFPVLHIGAEMPNGPLPRWYALRITVSDIGKTEQHLLAEHVPFERLMDGGLRVAPSETCGVLLEFVGPQ